MDNVIQQISFTHWWKALCTQLFLWSAITFRWFEISFPPFFTVHSKKFTVLNYRLHLPFLEIEPLTGNKDGLLSDLSPACNAACLAFCSLYLQTAAAKGPFEDVINQSKPEGRIQNYRPFSGRKSTYSRLHSVHALRVRTPLRELKNLLMG